MLAPFDKHESDAPQSIRLPDAGGDEARLEEAPPGAPVLPVVRVTVDGRGPYRFGIETGAQFVGVRPGLAVELGLSPLEPTIGLPRHGPVTITVGQTVFERVPVMEVRTAATDIDGFLGFPFWGDLTVTLDYLGGWLRLSRDRLPAPDGREVLPAVPVNGGDFVGVPVGFGDRTLTAIVDTRSTGAIGFTPASAEQVTFEGELREIGRARGAAIPESVVLGSQLAERITIGRHHVVPPFVAVRPLPEGFPTEPILGNALLRAFVLSLDLVAGCVRLARDGDDPVLCTQRPI